MTERPSAEREHFVRLLNAAMREGERVGQGFVGDYPNAMAPVLAAFDAVTRELAEWKAKYEVLQYRTQGQSNAR